MAEELQGRLSTAAGVTPVILVVDDEPAQVASLNSMLTRLGYDVVGANGGEEALEILLATRPDLTLLDLEMPGIGGFEVSAAMQADESLADVPVVFLTPQGVAPDRQRVFEAGAVECLEKPIDLETLDRVVRGSLRTTARWQARAPMGTAAGAAGTFRTFKTYLGEKLSLGERASEELDAVEIKGLYSMARIVGIPEAQLSALVAEFLGHTFVEAVDPSRTLSGVLPLVYCRANRIVPVEGEEEESVLLVLTNPFNQDVLDSVRRVVGRGRSVVVAVAEPRAIDVVLWPQGDAGSAPRASLRLVDSKDEAGSSTTVGAPTADLLQSVLDAAVEALASDIHIDARVAGAVVRLRVDGDMRELRSLTKAEARRLVSRLKVMGGMDIAEKRRPQDGGAEATALGREYKLRLATSATPHGEGMVIRIVDPSARAVDLTALGMTQDQEQQTLDMANRSQGLILVVGPTGGGKSTTVFSILSRIDTSNRSLISVEDPVEYRIPFAHQMQVNERGGVTFDALLRSAIRQDPDILFLGEIRDLLSGKAAVDFSSSGHLTVTTLHSANATTAIFRMERLGLSRATLAEGVTGIIAQKLLKRLCEDCRLVRPITAEERAWLAPFTTETPDEVADPVGCMACQKTGYRGREGVFEVVPFDADLTAAVRAGTSVGEIRSMVRQRGDMLAGSHGVEKVRDLRLSARDLYEQVLLEERSLEGGGVAEPYADTGQELALGSERSARVQDAPKGTDTEEPHLLLVDDDPRLRKLLERFLTNGGYSVTSAGDGAEALLCLGVDRFDAIISDINMPNLDGMEFLDVLTQKGIELPVVFLTGSQESEVEARAFEMGAADFIRKPVRKDVLLARLARLALHRPVTS